MTNRSALLMCSMLILPQVAHTQASPNQSTASRSAPGAGQPEDIVVTANKRQELLIDVPQSVTVVSGATLEHQQAHSFQDYLKLVPGLQLNQSTPGVGRLVLRGINTGGVASTVAVYVDETPFGSSSGLVNGSVLAGDFDTFDIARIEVLRGPQGTLYGASSLGGVLKFVTNDPQTDKLEARGRAGVETVKGGDTGYSAQAMLNVPLSDTLAVRGSGYYRKLGGFIDSIGTASSDVEKNINGSKSYGGRAALLFKPSETFSLSLGAVVQNIRSNASDIVESDPDTLHTLYNRLSFSQYVPIFTKVAYRVYSGTANLDLGFANLSSTTSYGTLNETFRTDLTTQFSPLLEGIIGPNEFYQAQKTNDRKLTEEIRLASKDNDRFEWLLGGYYTHEKGLIEQHLVAVVPGTLTEITGLPALGDVDLRSVYREFAGFGNATIHFGEHFDLSAGGRYSYNKQHAVQNANGILAGGDVSYPDARSHEDVVTYSVAPKIKFNDRTALYARVAKGFRPGGPNVLPPGAPVDTPPTYKSDSLVSYEVGLKAESADRVFTLDISAFHIDWKDIQLFALVNNFGINVNGARARSDGFEFTATVRPTTGLNLSANGAYTRARLRDDTDPLVGGLSGDALPFTPKYSVSVNADYEWAVMGDATAYVGGSLRSLSKQSGAYDFAFRSANDRQRQLPAYEVIDVRAGVTFGRYSLEAYARNLGNAAGRTSTESVGAYPNGAIGTGVIRPRTIGLTLGAGF